MRRKLVPARPRRPRRLEERLTSRTRRYPRPVGTEPGRREEPSGNAGVLPDQGGRQNVNAASARADYIPTLDGWRALAVLAVIMYHGTAPGTSGLTDRGYFGVMVFFSISGFLITARLQAELFRKGKIDFRGFYVRRFFRIIAPAYLFLTVLVLLRSMGLAVVTNGEVAASALFVRNLTNGGAEGAWYTGHLWSLSVEEQFYLTWPWVLALGFKRAEGMALILAFSVHAWRFFTAHMGVEGPLGLVQPWYDYIMWGCWWALFLRDEGRRNVVRRLLTFPVWCAVFLLFCTMVAIGPGRFVFPIGFLISVILVGTVLRPEGPPGRLLETPLLRWTGRISYGLYLWQQVFFVAITGSRSGPLQSFPVNMLALLAVTVPIYYFFERPLVNLGYRLTARNRPSMVPLGNH